MAHLRLPLENFVRAGNRLRIIVGIDLDNTTKEGLDALLALRGLGKVELFVYHNESGGIFHPKFYLFTGKTDARLIVGSNNLTQAGLYQNTEAGLSVDLPISDPIVKAAQDAINAWSDTTSGLSRMLDGAFLAELVANGYVRDEATARAEIAKRVATASKGKKKKLFGSVPVSVPAAPHTSSVVKKPVKGTPTKATSSASTGGVGSVVLMRLRKASVSGRPTQTQIPIAVANQPFFKGVKSVTSRHSKVAHPISAAVARGIVNTLKLEIPEMRSFADPVIRFESTTSGVEYEVYDSLTPKGQAIMNSLTLGLSTSPQSTFLTLPSSPKNATWWRFI
jgi:hypothetical protein